MNFTFRSTAFVGALATVTLIGTLPAYDTFEAYSAGVDVNNLSGGVGWLGFPFVGRWSFFSPVATDTFESYVAATPLDGLNGGDAYIGRGWSGAYSDRNAVLGVLAVDTFETYAVSGTLAGLNGGTTYIFSGSWSGTYTVH